MVPVALQGASSSTASSGSDGRQVDASACTTVTSRRSRARFSRRRPSRAGFCSTAVTRAPAAASCAALPPGAAQRSATRSSGCAASKAAGKAAAASCTQKVPSAKPGSSMTRVPAGKRTDPVGNASPPGGAGPRRDRSSGASVSCAAAMGACVRAPARPQPGRRIQPRTVQALQRALPSVATLRSTAFTRPAKGSRLRARASATEVATAAWAGVSSSSSCAAPRRST